MGKIIQKNRPCPKCNSHDARQVYEGGDSFCFSCRTRFPPQDGEDLTPDKEPEPKYVIKTQLSLSEIKELPTRGFKDRHVEKAVCDFYGVKVSYDEDTGEIGAHYYPYDSGKAYKVRRLPKTFSWVGNSKNLFGQHLFNGGGKRLVITEGEVDTLSVAQAYYDKYKKFYPVVSLSSSTATKSILENRDWVRSFQEVILFLDNDSAGEKALNDAIKYIGIDKIKIAKGQEKDANEILVKHGFQNVLQCIYDAAKYVPSGIITKEDLWEQLVSYNNIPSMPYPPCLGGVNEKVKGKRLGEIALFISGTGAGKSTMLREDMIWTIKQIPKEDKIGVISLEEAPAETARKLSGMELNRNPAKEIIPIDELKVGFDKLFEEDRIILLDHQGSMNDDSIVDKLEYMCLSGCKYIYIDHITILVSEGADGLTGNEAQDKVMNDLLRLVKRHPLWIGLVSHLRKTPNTGKSFEEGRLPSLDDIRGSGSIKQISFDIIAFTRNMSAVSETERNTIKVSVLKSRYTGLTGIVQGAIYDYDTGRLRIDDGFIKEDFIRVEG